MAKWEIKKLHFWRGRMTGQRYWMPCSLNIVEQLWWRFMPGTVITVRWPTGTVVAGPGPDDSRWYDCGGASYVEFESSNPNDHYRPYLEQHVGRQGRDWNWGLANQDAADGTLTIKIRRKYQDHATMLALKWA